MLCFHTGMAPKNPIVDVVPPMDEGDGLGLDQVSPVITEETHEQKRPPMRIVWRNVAIQIGLHVSALYALTLFPSAHPFTWLFSKYFTFDKSRNICKVIGFSSFYMLALYDKKGRFNTRCLVVVYFKKWRTHPS